MNLSGTAQAGPIATIRHWIGFACLVSAPIDVFDVFGFSGDFRLTPFLLLSALYFSVVIFEAIAVATYASPAIPAECFDVTVLAAASLICLMSSSFVFLSHDALNVAPARLVYGIWLVVFSILFVDKERKSLHLMIVRSTRLFILLDIAAVTAQIISAISSVEFPKYLEALSIKTAGTFFRPGGLISDPNRASVMLILILGFAYLAGDALPEKKRLGVFYYLAGLALACLTISRTGTVAIGLLLLIMFQRIKNKKRAFLWISLAAFVLLSAGAAYLTASESARDFTHDASQAFFERDWSNYEHFGVMEAGIQTFFGDPKVFLIGVGWGTEYEYTKTFFPGNKYGNFHCTYISFAVQGGVIALFCLLFLLFRPLLLRYEFGSLAIIFLWSGIFYQYHGDPLWWILLFALNKGTIRGGRTDPLLGDASSVMLRSHA